MFVSQTSSPSATNGNSVKSYLEGNDFVDLKLVASTGYRCHQLVWSQDPNKVPELLQGRISPEEWAATCALVDVFYRQQRKEGRKFRTSMNKIRLQRNRPVIVGTRKWTNVVLANEQQKYLSRGVDISLIMTKAGGQEFPKGLRFQIVDP